MPGVRWCSVFIGFVSYLLPATAQTPDPHLNVVVRDSRNRLVRGLEPADFTVTEEGAPASVRTARLVDASSEPVHLTLLFDRMRGEPARLSKEAAFELLSLSTPNVDFSVWLVDQKLIALQPPSSDRKLVKATVVAATGKNPPAPSADSSETTQSALHSAAQLLRESRYRPSVASVIALARAQQKQSGRKAIVYFSEGLPLAAGDESLLNAISAANRAAISVYVVDASGLAISKEEDSARQMAVNYQRALSQQTLNQTDQQGVYANPRVASGTLAVGNLEINSPNVLPSAIAQLAGKTGAFVINNGGDFRSPIRRLLDELNSYYEVTYQSPSEALDGRFHELRVGVRRDKVKVQSAAGFFAAPDVPGGTPLAFELPLFDLLRRAPMRDFPVAVETVQFRGLQPARPLVVLLLEVGGRNLQFDEDTAAGLYRAHVSILAVIRDSAGNIVERLGRDMPVQTPPGMLDEVRKRQFLFQEQATLAPGNYTLETAVQDRLSGRVNALKSEFTVSPATGTPAIEGLSLVRHLVAGADSKSDGAFALPGKNVVPAIDRTLQGGKGASATFFFRVYPAAPPPSLAFEFLREGKPMLHKALNPAPADPDRTAQMVTLDVGGIPSGAYDVRIIASDDGRSVSAQTRITIENGASPESGAPSTEEAEVSVTPAAAIPCVAPDAGQQRLIEQARAGALQYAAHLPNFVCTEVTRRLLDPAGKQEWRNLDESSQLVSYYDGQEHYENLTARSRTPDTNRYPPSLTSTGEFGSLLKSIFDPESAARFSWVRADSLRGAAVQVFAYSVDAQHSKYRVSHNVNGTPKAVLSAIHGQLYIDRETAIVLRLTLESESLPVEFPVRQVAVSLDYGDIEVGGQVYTLPLAFTLDVRLRKRTVIRNESVFRTYQRFTTNSRLLPTGK